ncbi:MAG: VOC family protein [Planctomycetaceae bacterium]|nr:VOC family protein [Planctomycetales bacterium]MCB9920826.1 VOC family protein [Planctomycetaceae bacterium]
MSESTNSIGAISWRDLTVPNASEVREFYEAVVGWTNTPVEMGGYQDFCMNTPGTGETVAGICHARGANAGLPAQWLIYVNVVNLMKSIAECKSRGGKVLSEPKALGSGQCAVIQDPAGACVALFERKSD